MSLKFTRLIAIVGALLVGSVVPAHAEKITIQGRVLNASGNPVTGATTQFRVQILTPSANRCVLYDETRTVDLSTSGGLFTLNLNDGSGTINLPSTYSLEQAISNRTDFAVTSTYCASGSGTVTYTPAASDTRKVVIQFMDPGSMSSFETIPEMDLNPVPYSIESRTVGGFTASNMLRVVDAGVPGAAPTFTTGQMTELQSLVAGTSNNYMSTTTGSTTGARLPTVSGNPATPTAGSIWFDTGSGAMKYYDGTTVQTVGTGSGSGTITGVTAGTGLAGGGTTGTVTVSLGTSGVTAASYGSATAVPVLTVDAYGRITAASTTAITGVLPAGTAGQYLRSDGTNWSSQKITMADLKSTIGGADLFSSPGCTAAQGLYWDSGTDQIKCQNIAINASALTAGTIADARLADVGTAGTYRVVTTDAKGRVTSGSNPTTLSGFGITDAVVNAGGIPTVSSGLLSARPAFGTAGRLYVSTDNLTLYRDNGTSWDVIGAAGGGTTITEVSAGTGLSGGGTSGNVTLNLTNVGTAGTYPKVTTDAQGRVTAGAALVAADIPNLDWAKITSGTPATLSGYGITDAVRNAGGTVSFAAGVSGSRPAFGTAGRFYYSTNTNILSYDTGAAWVDLTNANSGVASVAVTAPITNSGTGTAPNIGIAQASGSTSGYLSSTDWTSFNNKLSTALNSALIWVGNGSNVATPVTPGGDVTMTNAGAFTVTKLQGTAVSNTAPSTGQFLTYDGTSWGGKNINLADLKSTSSGTPALFASPGCTAAQALYWDSGTDQIKCQAIGGLNASAITAGTIDAARLPADASAWTVSGGNVYRSTGNVGVGTSNPSAKWEIVDTSGGSSFVNMTSYSDTPSGGGGWIGRHARGTPGAPTAIQASDRLNGLWAAGYNGTGWNANSAAIIMNATENYSSATNNGANIVFETNPNGSSGRFERMRIEHNGNVGINSASPGYTLDVGGVVRSSNEIISTSTAAGHFRMVRGNYGVMLRNDGTDFYILQTASADQYGTWSSLRPFAYNFATGNVSLAGGAVTALYGGSVGIGTSAPLAKLHAKGAGEAGSMLRLTDTTTSGGDYTITSSAGGVLGLFGIGDANTSTYRMVINPAGSVGIGTTNPAVSLDLGARTDALALPKGTTAQQPASPAAGMIRWNTATPGLELYNGSAWVALTTGGADSYLSSSGGTLSGGLTISTGGLNLTNSGITNAGSITGVGSNITGSNGLTIASGGTNQNLALNGSGTGAVTMGGGTGTSLSVLAGPASTVNYVTVQGAATGGSPTVSTAGGDANINLSLSAKGTGRVLVPTNGLGINTSIAGQRLRVYENNLSATITAWTEMNPAFTANTGGNFHSSWNQFTESTNFNMTGAGYAAVNRALTAAGTTGTIQQLVGATNDVLNNGDKTINVAIGGTGSIGNGGAGTITEARALYTSVANGSGTITNAYGLYVGSIQGTNKWSVYTSDANAPSYFSGKVGIGTTGATSPLDIYTTADYGMRIRSPGLTTGANGYAHPLSIMNPAASAGETITASIGQSESAKNAAYFGFVYNGAASNSNYATIGLWTVDHILNLTGAGYVGIGVTNPGSLLQLGSTTYQNDAAIRIATGNGSAQRMFSVGSPYGGATTSGRYYDFIIRDETAGIDRLNIDYATGWIGMGTSTPAAQLEVASTSNEKVAMMVSTPGTQASQQSAVDLVTKSNNTYLGAAGNKGWSLFARGDALGTTGEQNDFGISYWNGSGWFDAIRVDSLTGHVGLRSHPNASYPIYGTGNAMFTGSLTIDNIVDYVGNFHIDTVAGSYVYSTWYGGVGLQVGNGTGGGYGPVHASAFNVSSDRTLKRNIKTIGGALDLVNQLNGVRFDWIDPKMGKEKQVGVIAQDVQKAFPELVSTNPETKKLTVNYSGLVSPLIEAVKELYQKWLGDHKRIDELEKQMAAKDRELASVKAKAEKVQADADALKARLDRIEKALAQPKK